MATYCIMCGKKKSGIQIQNDMVLDAIRWFKRNVTKDEQRNKLVVCKEDYPRYKKNRDRYMLRLTIYMGIGILFMVFGLILSFRIGTFIAGLGILLFLYLLSLMNYTPKLQVDQKAVTSKK